MQLSSGATGPTQPAAPAPRPYGLARFYRQPRAAGEETVVTPFKHDYATQVCSRCEEGLPNQSYHGASLLEVSAIWEMLSAPGKSVAEVLERQRIMTALLSNTAAFEKILEARHAAYAAAGHIEFLLESTEEETDRAVRAGERAKSRLKEMLAAGFPLEEKAIQEKARQIDEQSEDERDFKERAEREKDELIQRLAAVSRIRSDLLSLTNELNRLSHPAWHEIAWEHLREVHKLPAVTAESLARLAAQDNHTCLAFIKEAYGGALEKNIAKITAPVVAGRIILEEGFAKATCDQERPECFSKAWNVLKEKGPGAYWSSKSHERINYRQVMNDSPEPHGETYLCGSQMSGKSFILDTWFYLRLWGQSFGYIPAETGNLHVAEQLVFLHRLGSEVTSRERSSFQTEVESGWSFALKNLPRGAIACLDLSSDEAFSTTSPLDQYRLLTGVVRYLRARGVRVVLATHNGEFLALKDGAPDVGIYHLKVETGSAGRIRYTHELQKGLDSSHALEVARRMNVPPHILKRAAEFLAGNPLPVRALAEDVWRLETFSEKERALLKKKPLSFRFLWPHRSEAQIEAPDRYRSYPRLSWVTDDSCRVYNGFGEPTLEPNRELGTVSATTDRLMRASELRFKDRSQAAAVAATRAGELLVAGHCPDGGVKEVLERQKMFDELLKGDRAARLLQHSRAAHSFIWSLRHLFREDTQAFPREILPAMAAWAPHWEDQPLGCRLFLDLLELIEQAAGVRVDSKLALHAKASLLRLMPLLGEERELYRKSWSGALNREQFKEQHAAFCRKAGVPASAAHSVQAAARLLAAQADAALVDVKLKDLDPVRVQDKLDALWEPLEKLSEATGWVTDPPVRAQRALWLLNERPVILNALSVLRETDSVYLHGFANYLAEIHTATIGTNLTGTDMLRLVSRHGKYSSAMEQFRTVNTDVLLNEWFKLECLARFACEIKDSGYGRVNFNDTGDFVVKDAWSITLSEKEREREIRNNTELAAGVRCEILESPNGSGKTFYLRDRTWLVRCAMATGYAPAKFVTMPPFAKVAYLDRVASDLDQNLSAFGNEVTQWMRMPIHFEVTPEAGWFIAVDEAWSSSDPHSQAALSDGVLAELLQNGNVLLFSSHNHDWAGSFAARAAPFVKTSHFAAEISGGKVRYDYAKRTGPAPSHGLEVAEAYGMPEEVIRFARLAPEVNFAKKQTKAVKRAAF